MITTVMVYNILLGQTLHKLTSSRRQKNIPKLQIEQTIWSQSRKLLEALNSDVLKIKRLISGLYCFIDLWVQTPITWYVLVYRFIGQILLYIQEMPCHFLFQIVFQTVRTFTLNWCIFNASFISGCSIRSHTKAALIILVGSNINCTVKRFTQWWTQSLLINTRLCSPVHPTECVGVS